MATSLRTCGCPSNTWFLGPIRAHNPSGIPIGSAVFAQMTVVSLHLWDVPSSQKCPFTWGIWTSIPGPIRVLNPNDISIKIIFQFKRLNDNLPFATFTVQKRDGKGKQKSRTFSFPPAAATEARPHHTWQGDVEDTCHYGISKTFSDPPYRFAARA